MHRSRGRRIAIMVLAGLVAVICGVFSADVVARKRSVDAAMGLFPFDRQAPVMAFDRQFQSGTPLRDAKTVISISRRALSESALNAPALRLLGQGQFAIGREQLGLALIRLAERVSRRDLPTQVFLLEEAVARGSISEALVHYDRALRTRPGSFQLLFPVLAKAIDDPAIRAGLVTYVRTRTPWMATFLNFAALDPKRTAAAADLLISARADRNPRLLDEVGSTLITRLVERGELGRAVSVMRLMGGDTAIVSDPSWTPMSVDQRFAGLAWVAADTPTASGRFSGAITPAFGFYVAQGVSVPVLTKQLALKPGRYLLAQQTAISNRETDSALVWQIRCVGRPELLWKSASLLVERPVRVAGPVVPVGCPFQSLELIASGGNGTVGLDATVEGFQLSRQ